MKNSLVFILFVFNFSFAQKYELGKVTVEELQEKRHSLDSTASAAILFKKVKTFFDYNVKDGFIMKTSYSYKIKIYKKEGTSWGDFEIPYYIGYKTISKDVVFVIVANTYNFYDGKVIKSEVDSNGKFKNKINEFWETKIISFPKVQEGSIIELKYDVISKYFSELPVFQYQYKIPVDYAQYISEVPGFYQYKAINSGYIKVNFNDFVEKAFKTYEDEYRKTRYLNYQQLRSIYEIQKVPAFKDEKYVKNSFDYFGKVDFELQTIHYPDESPKKISETWEDVAKSIYSEKNFGNELKKSDYFLDDFKRVIKDCDSKEEQMRAIFHFVKTKMIWNNSQSYYTKNGVVQSYQGSIGNSAEINLILTAMLKMAGLESAPVVLSTRDNGSALFPSKIKLNHVIACVYLDGIQYLMDATEKYSDINVLPLRDLNGVGRWIGSDLISKEIDLVPKILSNNIVTLNYSVNPVGLVSGKVRRQMTDYNALLYRKRVEDVVEETYLEKLENENDKIEIEGYQRNNAIDINLPVSETFSFTGSNLTEVIGGKIYINPMLFYTSHENPFKQEVREYPVDFGFPFMDKYVINIQIPDGYKIESMPNSVNFSMVDNLGSFKFMTSASGNTIQVSIVSQMNTPIISSEYYTMLKEYYKTMIDKQNEKIVLVRI
ncbi:MAG: hypothetical protein RLZZ323_1020 [Bacteroidota bacterium]|jgi:transglutaminase-like putative cysteine protease